MSREPTRLYGNGTVGMMVVLDHVHLGDRDPLSKYPQPAFFTITQAPPSETPGSDAYYVLRDTSGHEVSTKGHSTANYLYKVDEWHDWRAGQAEQDHAHQVRTISTLRDRLELLKEIMASQGVRVITSEQAAALGIKS